MADARPTLEVIPEKSLELVRQEGLEIVRESLELVRETLDLELKDEPVLPPEPFALVNEPETPMVHVSATMTPDEISIPPAGDLAVEPVVERFFSEGDLGEASSRESLVAAHGADDEDEEWDDSPRSQKAKLKASPEAIARRAKLSRYVSMAVAGAAVVCIAAFARSIGMPSSSARSAKTTNAVTAVAPPVAKAAEPAAIAPVVQPAAQPAAPVAAKEEPTPAQAAPAEEPKAPEAKAAEPKVEDAKPAVPVSDKTALEEKKISLRALERGKLADAIEAGERSVALDPTDGEAWLLLGAAYQQKGNGKDAYRCFAACVKEGKRGPVGECRALLR